MSWNIIITQTGDLVIRPILADTLTQIAVNRSDAFYTGPIAESIVQAVHDSYDGGILTMDDLSSYEARLEEPIHVDYNGGFCVRIPNKVQECVLNVNKVHIHTHIYR